MIFLVTGANRGIGLEVVRQLSNAEGDHKIILTCRNMEKGLLALQSVMDTSNVQIECKQLDITNSESIANLKTQLIGLKINVLINNAAVYDKKTRDFENATLTLKTNFTATVEFTRQMADLMSADGRIINVSSGLGALSNCKSEEIKNRVIGAMSLEDLEKLGQEYLQAVQNKNTNGWPYDAYYVSKMLLNKMTVLWNDILPIPVVAMNPGWTKTDMGGFGAIREVWEGADTIVYLSLTPDIKQYGGKFVQDRQIITF